MGTRHDRRVLAGALAYRALTPRRFAAALGIPSRGLAATLDGADGQLRERVVRLLGVTEDLLWPAMVTIVVDAKVSA